MQFTCATLLSSKTCYAVSSFLQSLQIRYLHHCFWWLKLLSTKIFLHIREYFSSCCNVNFHCEQICTRMSYFSWVSGPTKQKHFSCSVFSFPIWGCQPMISSIFLIVLQMLSMIFSGNRSGDVKVDCKRSNWSSEFPFHCSCFSPVLKHVI